MFQKNRLNADEDTESLPALEWQRDRSPLSPAMREIMSQVGAPASSTIMIYRRAEASPTVQLTGAIMAVLKQTRQVVDELYVASVIYGSLEVEHNQAVRHRDEELFDGLFRFVLGKTLHELPILPEIKLPQWLRLRMGESIPSSGQIIPRDWVICVLY